MKDGVILANAGHFNVEIDIPALRQLATASRESRPLVEELELPDGRRLYLIAEGRLVNLAAAEGHPAAVMDMSFANQALSAEYAVENAVDLERRVYPVPEDIDREIARLKLATLGIDRRPADRGAGEVPLLLGRGHLSSDLAPEDVVRLAGDRVVLLDQRRLPGEAVELECRHGGRGGRGDPDARRPRRCLDRRGGGHGLCARRPPRGRPRRGGSRCCSPRGRLPSTCAWAIDEMRRGGSDPDVLAERARAIHRDEVSRCVAMGEHAAALFSPGARALTHCNTGALATAGHGSALGALRTAFARGLLEHVFVGETRPLDQGARLTAWELERAGIPYTVQVDGAAGALMAAGEVTHVFVGADRIAANGDVANKIGTYSLAVLAAYHRIPFVVVAPTSTIDRNASAGGEIPVEERSPREVSERFSARNPAFDVTPAALVGAIVTEAGVHRAPYERSLAAASPSAGRAG